MARRASIGDGVGRSYNLNARTTYKVKIKITKHAEKLGISLSDLIERATLDYIERTK